MRTSPSTLKLSTISKAKRYNSLSNMNCSTGPSTIFYVEVLTPSIADVTVFEDRTLTGN